MFVIFSNLKYRWFSRDDCLFRCVRTVPTCIPHQWPDFDDNYNADTNKWYFKILKFVIDNFPT